MNRRDLIKLSSMAIAASSTPSIAQTGAAPASRNSVARWDRFELPLAGPSAGNPFLDVRLQATFRKKERALTVYGFFVGDGSY